MELINCNKYFLHFSENIDRGEVFSGPSLTSVGARPRIAHKLKKLR